MKLEVFEVANRKTFYGEAKKVTSFSLTPTALEWLEQKQSEFKTISLSDTIERLARQDKPEKTEVA